MAHCEAPSESRAERPDLAAILRQYAPGLSLNSEQARVVSALSACRTAALGGHLQRCDRCGRESPVYNSCRNRHCPKCQSLRQALWVEAQLRDLLPGPYFHLVFTLPHCLHPLFRCGGGRVFSVLFWAVARTVIELCRSNLGATPGILAVLHTWTQTLDYHVHIHCIVSGGGLSLDGERWIGSRPRFFLPVRRLSRVFRGKLLHGLERALLAGELRMQAASGRLLLRRAAAHNFVVYSKPPLLGPEQVVRYLGRYTHRIAIGNERLLAHADGQVRFRYKDRKHGGRRKTLTLPGAEFSRRFLLHVVPRHFVRVRHFGLLANGIKARRLARARSLLAVPAAPEPTPPQPETWLDTYRRLVGSDPLRCPACRVGRLIVVAEIPPAPIPLRRLSGARSP